MGYIMKNYMKDCIEFYIDAVLDDVGSCKCEICVTDITAIALNSLPAKYVVTEEGVQYNNLNKIMTEYKDEIVDAIIRAVGIVNKNAHH